MKKKFGPPSSHSQEASELRQVFWDAQPNNRTPDKFIRDDSYLRESENLLEGREFKRALDEESQRFAPEAPTMDALYNTLGVESAYEVNQLFDELDQREMQSGNYDYNNKESLLNKIKSQLEVVDPESLSQDEKQWRDEMLWIWNHHAAGMALFGHQDFEGAQAFVKQAEDHMAEGHPNKITGLLGYLSHQDLAGAEQWTHEVVGDNEKDSALSALQNYKEYVVPYIRK